MPVRVFLCVCVLVFFQGADEVTLLNITAYLGFPLNDHPMLKVLERASQKIFIPITVRGWWFQ